MTQNPVRVLEIRHADSEPPGAYGPALDEVAEVTTLRIWREPVPVDLAGVDAIIVLGGAMGVGDAERLPWITEEIALLARAVEAGIPVWGVCLGAQMLTKALGGEVFTGPSPELGVRPVTFNDAGLADPVWGPALHAAGHHDEIDTVHWHFDACRLPAGADLLASSAQCDTQLYRKGNCYGVQFHLEAGGALVSDWLSHPESRADVVEVLGDAATDRFIDEAGAVEVVTTPLARGVMHRWLTEVVATTRDTR
ncbi:type 1 glutamine amidotransferase [Gordonia terrae]|uniref:type 1 glutamine amidotransferase n=1 Tax=Gordonia terrae TaxID=2055 RepID=UPI003F6CA96A